MEDEETKSRTIWCGNLSNRVTEEIIYELFLQAGPIEGISLPKDKQGVNRGYAFITYKHQCTVNYAVQLFEETSLYDRKLRITPRGGGLKKCKPILLNPITNSSINGSMNNKSSQQFSNNSQADLPKMSRSLMEMPFIMSPIPLADASLRGQWSHSSPYHQSPPKNHTHDSNRRYQDRYQSNYYDRKRDDRSRKRRK